ncbi:hypothetical protein Poly51_30720 [Rubripirellula tenax]|uniref:Uncharacterized protein n=1 Tax=Rubripirellula tenax TaxID=2528015 RepID=A0A5C6EZX1_9BACT|nr:hypothetical protein [Rubripirellula tenax]TWU54355.1 hypothetical protein Poly51_30720 [Rubripirellula tenax]
MNDRTESRLLCIEALESRSLLAGNPFAADVFDNDVHQDHFGSRDRLRNQDATRPNEVSSLRPGFDRIGNSNRGRHSDNRFDTPQKIRVETVTAQPPTAAGVSVVFATSPPTQAAQPVTASKSVSISPSASAAPSASTPQPASASQSLLAVRAVAVDAALAGIVATDVVESTDTATRVDEAVQTRLDDDSESKLAIASVISRSQASDFSTPDTSTDDDPDNELIELAPWNLNGRESESADASRAPWQLDLDAISTINSVIGRASTRQSRIADAIIHSWFGGSGGMIAIDRIDLPSVEAIADGRWMNVQLESTVMLHRSLELIASGSAPMMSDEVLDVIMASIGQMKDSESQPIGTHVAFRLPAVAYPAIAILTGAAIAARRKHKLFGTLT